MRLQVFLPMRVLLDEKVKKVRSEAENGSFCLLPRHADFVATLVPGLLFYETEEEEFFLALGGGVLVKQSSSVFVSTPDAVLCKSLEQIEKAIEERFTLLNDREKRASLLLARTEADFVHKLVELEEHGSR